MRDLHVAELTSHSLRPSDVHVAKLAMAADASEPSARRRAQAAEVDEFWASVATSLEDDGAAEITATLAPSRPQKAVPGQVLFSVDQQQEGLGVPQQRPQANSVNL